VLFGMQYDNMGTRPPVWLAALSGSVIIRGIQPKGRKQMTRPYMYEGTAEEIAEQLRGSNLTGALKAIVTPMELHNQHGNGMTPNLADTLADFLAEVDQTEFTPGKPRAELSPRGLNPVVAPFRAYTA